MNGKAIIGLVGLAVVLSWFAIDGPNLSQVISAGAGGFNTSVRALEPPQASSGSTVAGA